MPPIAPTGPLVSRPPAHSSGQPGLDTSPHTGGSKQQIAAGLLTTLVGYASSVAVVIQGLTAVGATTEQVASALVLLGLGMCVVACSLSLMTRMPVSAAWSTPGAALLATAGMMPGGFPSAVGAFIVTGGLIMLTAFWTPLGRLIRAIPASLASAMLGGVLLKLCLAPFSALTQVPLLALPILLVWAVMMRIAKLYAVPVAAALAVALIALTDPPHLGTGGALWPTLEFVTPVFEPTAMVSIALPLFLVTMASQNIPGFAVLASFGYHPPAKPVLAITGAYSIFGAFFGALTVNLAAITAALCAGPDAGPDPKRRYIATLWSGVGYIATIPLAMITATVVVTAPPVLIQAAAGLALLGAFGQSMLGAVKEEGDRIPAVVTFLVSASGLTFFGIGPAFWGLVAGGVVLVLFRLRTKPTR